MKCTYFHRNCWKKIAQNDRSHAMDISRITKVILKNCQKIGKMTPLTVKNEIFKNLKSLEFCMIQGSLNPNITFLGQKLWPVAWNQKFTSVIQGKKMKNAYKKCKNSKNKNMYFFLMSQGSLNPKIRFLSQDVCPVARSQMDRQTRKVKTEDTLSGFQDFFLQPIIKDRPNTQLQSDKQKTYILSKHWGNIFYTAIFFKIFYFYFSNKLNVKKAVSNIHNE